METLVSVDLGTTGCKAAVCAASGQVLGESYFEYPLITLGPERIEQDARLWWSLTLRAIRDAIGKSGAEGYSVVALSVSSQGISFVPIDESGVVLCNAISWLDTRAAVEAGAIGDAMGEERLFHLTGKRPEAFYVLPKLLWLREHEPGTYSKARKFFMAHDYLLYRFCGATATDFSMAGGTMLLDLHSLAWCDDLLSTFDIDSNLLPEVAWAGSVAGGLDPAVAGTLGLRPGIPVAVGGQDQKCAALGAGIRPGVATVSLGTASAISCLMNEPILDPKRRIPTYPFVVPGYWDFEGVIGTAGGALKWFRNTFFPGGD